VKKILGLTIAALLVMATVAGGTYAYFSDVETSTGNTITAGTLNLVPSEGGAIAGTNGSYTQNTVMSDGIDGYVTFANVAPGNTGNVEWVLSNSGSLAGTLTLAASTINFDENTGSQMEPEIVAIASNGATNLGLGDLMGVWVQKGVGTDAATARIAFADVLGATGGYVPASGLEAALTAITTQAMAASGGSDTVVIKINWSLATDLKTAGPNGVFGTGGDDVDVDDNIIQGDNATINASFVLNQLP
jgi:predicted ribosomally synthesized peptide with SipW-like signal peptide